MNQKLYRVLEAVDDVVWRPIYWIHNKIYFVKLLLLYPKASRNARHMPFNQLPRREKVSLSQFRGSEVFLTPDNELLKPRSRRS